MNGRVFKRCTTCGRRIDTPGHADLCDGQRATWSYRADLGWDRNGRRIQRRGGSFPTKREAERALREVLTKVDNSTYVEPSDRTVETFLLTEWLPTQLPPRVSTNRYRNERNAVERHLVPFLGHLRLQDLNAAQLERFYSDLLHGGSPPDAEQARKPLGAATVLQIHGVIRKALRDAVKWGLVERNVATSAEPPSNATVKADRRRAIQVWNPEQLAAFVEATADHWLHALWLLAATTGLRRGELVGLVDDAVDLDAARLVVDWQLIPEEQPRDPGRTIPVHKRVLKVSGSGRAVDLDQFTVAALRRWLSQRAEWQTAVGDRWRQPADLPACATGHAGRGHGSFLFTWADGRHLNPDWVSHEFTRLCTRAGVPVIRPHDVRHTHASLLLASGEHLKVVQERLGWASTAFMLDTYTHLLPGMQADAAQRFAAGLFGEADDPS